MLTPLALLVLFLVDRKLRSHEVREKVKVRAEERRELGAEAGTAAATCPCWPLTGFRSQLDSS